MSTDLGPLELVALGCGTLWPRLARACARSGGLASKPATSVFCSELVTRLLQRLGHVDAVFEEHWLVAPLALTSAVRVLDTLSARSSDPLAWGAECAIVCGAAVA